MESFFSRLLGGRQVATVYLGPRASLCRAHPCCTPVRLTEAVSDATPRHIRTVRHKFTSVGKKAVVLTQTIRATGVQIRMESFIMVKVRGWGVLGLNLPSLHGCIRSPSEIRSDGVPQDSRDPWPSVCPDVTGSRSFSCLLLVFSFLSGDSPLFPS